MSAIEIVSMRPFTTVNVEGQRVDRTLITFREPNGPVSSKTVPGSIRDPEEAKTAVRGGE